MYDGPTSRGPRSAPWMDAYGASDNEQGDSQGSAYEETEEAEVAAAAEGKGEEEWGGENEWPEDWEDEGDFQADPVEEEADPCANQTYTILLDETADADEEDGETMEIAGSDEEASLSGSEVDHRRAGSYSNDGKKTAEPTKAMINYLREQRANLMAESAQVEKAVSAAKAQVPLCPPLTCSGFQRQPQLS